MGDELKWTEGLKLTAQLPVPGYAMDDATAIQVRNGAVEVISEGHWQLFTP